MDTKQNTYPGKERRPDEDCGCEDRDCATKKAIVPARQTYCTNLQTAKADQGSAEKTYDRAVKIYRKKKKLFEWTEHNFRLYRDFDICLDTELTTGNASLTANVKAYSALSATLYANLKAIVAGMTDLKTKVSALRDQASNLDNYKNDLGNATQWTLLTGKTMDNCKGEEPHHPHPPHRGERPEACRDAEQIYCDLIFIPKKVLVFDANSLLQSAADTTGIQTFSNVDILTTQQAALSTASAALVTQITTTLKARTADLATVQADLVTSVQECTSAGVDKYNKISVCDGAHQTLEFLCCPVCKCVKPEGEHPYRQGEEEALRQGEGAPHRPERPCEDHHHHHPRLAECECCICRICEIVKSTYRGGGESKPGDEDCGCN